jgi:hypothetical protein
MNANFSIPPLRVTIPQPPAYDDGNDGAHVELQIAIFFKFYFLFLNDLNKGVICTTPNFI